MFTCLLSSVLPTCPCSYPFIPSVRPCLVSNIVTLFYRELYLVAPVAPPKPKTQQCEEVVDIGRLCVNRLPCYSLLPASSQCLNVLIANYELAVICLHFYLVASASSVYVCFCFMCRLHISILLVLLYRYVVAMSMFFLYVCVYMFPALWYICVVATSMHFCVIFV